jgi:branched-chain amino acid transport system substrate-binding protein
MSRRTRRFSTAAALSAVALLVAGCGSDTEPSASGDAEGTFKVGVIEDKSGGATFYSQSAVAALKVYAESLNAGEFLYAEEVLGGDDGIMGQPIELIFEDDQNNPNTTNLKARSLIDKGAEALIFTSGSSSTLQGRAVCTQAKILCVAPTNTNATIVDPPNNEFIFTTAPPSSLAAEAYINAWEKEGYSTIAFFAENSATAKGVADAYKAAAQEAGLKIVADETVEPGASNATAQIARISDAGPDVIFDATQGAVNSALLYQGLDQAGVEIPVYANNALTAQPKTWEIVGDALDGVRVVDPLSPDNDRTKQVVQLLRDGGVNEPVTFIQTTTWDALLLLKHAIEEAGSADGEAAVAAFEKITGFPAATGQDSFTYSFSETEHNGSSLDQNVVVEFEGAQPSTLVAGIQPGA